MVIYNLADAKAAWFQRLNVLTLANRGSFRKTLRNHNPEALRSN